VPLADTNRVQPHRFFLASTFSLVWTFLSAWVTVELNTGDVCCYVKREVELNFSDAASDLRQKTASVARPAIFVGSEFFTLAHEVWCGTDSCVMQNSDKFNLRSYLNRDGQAAFKLTSVVPMTHWSDSSHTLFLDPCNGSHD